MRGCVISSEDRAAYDAVLRAGATAEAIDLCVGLVASGVPPSVVTTRLLRPAQREVGRRWALGGWTVAQEHVATGVTTAVLDALAEAVPADPPGEPVLVACPGGESHVLAAAMVLHVLRWRGVAAEGGATLAGAALADRLAAEAPRLLALSCSMTAHLPGVAAAVEVAAARGVPVVGGGVGFGAGGRFAPAVGVPAWAATAGEVARRVDAWSHDPPVAAMPPAEPLACRRARRLGPAVVDDVVGNLLAGTEPERAVDVLCDAAGWAVELAVSAIRTGRPDILADGLADVAATLGVGDGPGPAVAARFADQVRVALGRHGCLPDGLDAAGPGGPAG